MADYEGMYYQYRQKYYEACSEISNCEHQIYNLKDQRKKTKNIINQLKVDIKNTQKAIEAVKKAINCENKLNTSLAAISTKTVDASSNFKKMVSSSNVTNKDLTEVYSEETAKTKNSLKSVLESLKTKKSNLDSKLSDLNAELNRANNELQEIENSIRREESDLSYWRQKKSSYASNMEYYRRKMYEEASAI